MKYPTKISVFVYRDAHSKFADCTNGGASSTHNTLTLIAPDADLSEIEESHRERTFRLVQGAYPGTAILVPAFPPSGEGIVGPMAGGNFAATSDSRFSQMIEDITGHRFYGAIPIHDRYESAELNRLLSQ